MIFQSLIDMYEKNWKEVSIFHVSFETCAVWDPNDRMWKIAWRYLTSKCVNDNDTVFLQWAAATKQIINSERWHLCDSTSPLKNSKIITIVHDSPESSAEIRIFCYFPNISKQKPTIWGCFPWDLPRSLRSDEIHRASGAPATQKMAATKKCKLQRKSTKWFFFEANNSIK